LVLLAVVPAILFVLYEGLRQRRLDEDKIEEGAVQLARAASMNQRRLVESTRQLLAAMAQVPAVRQGTPETCTQFLSDEFQLHSGSFTGFGLADLQGKVISSAQGGSTPTSVVDRTWFRAVLETREFARSAFELEGGTTPTMVLAQPVLKRDGKQVGAVLFATMNLRWVSRLAVESELPEGSSLTLVDLQGVVMTRYPEMDRWVGRSILNHPVGQALSARRGVGSAKVLGLDGVMKLYGFAVLRMGGPEPTGYVAVGVPVVQAYLQANRDLQKNIGILLGVALLALLAIHIGGSLLFVRPLTGLSRVTQQLANGNLQARTGGPYGEGEVEQLRRSFDEMATALESQALQLQRSNRALRTVSECNQALMRATDEAELLNEVCRIIVDHGGYRMAWVGMAEHDPVRSVRSVAQAGAEDGYLALAHISWADTERGRGPTGTAIRTGQPKLVTDVRTDPSFVVWRDQAVKQGYLSVLGLPLRIGDETFGALTIYSGEVAAFDEAEMALLMELAGDLVYGLSAFRDRVERERAERQLQESEQRFRSIVESSPMGMHFYELQGDDRLIFRGSNHAAEIILGVDHSQFIGKPLDELFPALFKTDVPERYRDACRNGTAWRWDQIQYEDVRVSGAFEVHAFQTAPGRMAAMFFDVTERRRAQAAVEQSERRFRALFEASPDAIFVEDLEGNVLDVNPAACRLHDLKREQLVGRNVRDLVPEDQRRLVGRDFPKLARAEWSETEGISLRADGTPVPVEIKASRMDYAGRPALLLHVRDISLRQEAEQNLRESESRYRAVVEQSADGIYMVDVETKQIVESNVALRQMLGYATDAPLNLRVYDIVADDPTQVDQRLAGVILGEQPATMERRYRRRDGVLIDVVVSTAVISAAGRPLVCTNVRDVTEQKRAEEVRIRLATAVEQAVEGIMITDANGTIQYVNPALEMMSGYSRAELVGNNPRIFKSGKQDASHYNEMWQALQRGEVWRGFFFNRRKDGTVYQDESMISPIRDGNGRVTSYVAVKRDVTREIQLEIQLLQAQKMEAIGRLAGGLAHDFNNILTAITGYSELSMKRLRAGDPLYRNCEEILKSADRASSLTRQLLAFSRRQVLEMKVLNPNSLVTNLQKMLRRLIGEDIELTTQLAEDVWSLKADPGQIEQVIMNLVVNARDAMPLGGKITISTGNATVTEPRSLSHGILRPGEYVCLSVTDTGVGMDEEVRTHLFEPFFTTKTSEKGTGLGLATCYGIVSQTGGSITVASATGAGTTFQIFLPRHQQDAQPAAAVAPRATAPASRHAETILLAEDEPAVRELSQLILSDLGYQVLVAGNGAEALALYQAPSTPKIDLLVTDVIMPEMGGRELAERLRVLNPELKILFVSGYTAETDWVSRALAKNTQFLPKPFTAAVLGQKVHDLLSGPA
jgi:PAS domain S-box-containing protein